MQLALKTEWKQVATRKREALVLASFQFYSDETGLYEYD